MYRHRERGWMRGASTRRTFFPRPPAPPPTRDSVPSVIMQGPGKRLRRPCIAPAGTRVMGELFLPAKEGEGRNWRRLNPDCPTATGQRRKHGQERNHKNISGYHTHVKYTVLTTSRVKTPRTENFFENFLAWYDIQCDMVRLAKTVLYVLSLYKKEYMSANM